MRVLTWESGAALEGKRLHVALIVECEGDCKRALETGLKLFSKIERKPIVTWSDYYRGFVLATRFPRPADEVKGFCEDVSGAYVEACERAGGEPLPAELELAGE